MSPTHLSGILYDALKDDAQAVAQIRTELSSLAKSIALNPEKGKDITSATVNGQSYAANVSLTNLERLGMLRIFIRGIDEETRPAARTYGRF